jgi:S-adenosylmethionine:tRNA ribosyltransferase-isomerase
LLNSQIQHQKSKKLLSQYDYHLPKHLIALEKADPPDSSKLLVYDRKSDKITHSTFKDIASFIPKETAIIFNDTKVLKARIFGHKSSGGKCELLLERDIGDNKFKVLIKGKTKVGTILNFEDNLKVKIVKINEDTTREVIFYKEKILNFDMLLTVLDKIGHTPLPPYIKREDNNQDVENYQSIFAKNIGSVAAPTASLHFTKNVLKTLENFEKSYLTLHVGLGTFKSVDTDNILHHKMHSEWYSLDDKTQNIINSDKKILAVGTTSTRAIEHYVDCNKSSGMCNIFLHPQNKLKRVDYLLTNFHLPKSTLIMLVSSLIGVNRCKELYNIAIKNNYRFYSYGDAMLIL